MRTQSVKKYVAKKRGLYAYDGGEAPDFVSQSSENADEPINLNKDIDVTSADPDKNYVEQSSQNAAPADKKKGKKLDTEGMFDRPDSPDFKFNKANRADIQNYMNVSRLNAASGGEYPDDEEEPEADVPDEAEPAPVEPEPVAPSSGPGKASSANLDDEAAKQAAIKSYLTEQYGKAADDSGIKDAIKDQKHQNFVANLSEGLHEMATARGVANGMAPDSGRFFQGMRDQGKAGVDQATAARQQAIQGFLQQNEMTRQVVQDRMANGTFEDQRAAAKVVQDRNDPTSAASAAMRPRFAKLWSEQLAGADVSNMSVAQMDDIAKQYEVSAKIDEAKAAAQMRAEAQKTNAQVLADSRDARSQQKQERDDAKTDAKTSGDQRKAFLEMENKGMGGRGAPQYITQNMKTQQSIKNAQKMLDELPKNPKTGAVDYDHMNDKQIHLFNTELERIASNGSPTESGKHAMEADTIASHWAAFKQKIGGSPTPANVGEFVRQNATYLKDLKESVDSTVNAFRRENFENYASAGSLSDEHMEKYKTKHPELFTEEAGAGEPENAPAMPVANAKGGDGQAIAAPAGDKQPDGRVKIQDPETGEIRQVAPDAVAKYVKKGGKVVP